MMIRYFLMILCAMLDIGAASAEPARYYRFDRGVVVDATGFAQPMAAASLLIPHGWRMSGGVLWGQEFLCTNGYGFDWQATAPDGSAGIMFLPQMKWENSNYPTAMPSPGCSSAPFTTARDYVLALVGRTFPGGQVLAYRDRPDIVQHDGQPPTRTAMPMGELRGWTEAGEALVAFNVNGQDMRGTISAAVQFQLTTTSMAGYGLDPSLMPGGSDTMQALVAYAQPAWVAYAPNGRLDFGYFESLRRSIEPNQQWAQAIANHNNQIGRVALEESRKQAAILMQTNEAIARIQQETWDMRQASDERQLREFGELMKGVETYADPNAPGGSVELSNSYRDAWRLRDGTYLLSNDPNFDPWQTLQVEGTRLEPVQ